MGVEKFNRPVLKPADRYDLSTGISTASSVPAYGVRTIDATTANQTFTLSAPVAGQALTLLIDTSSTGVVTIETNSSATTLFGSTLDTIACTTGQAGLAIELVGLTTAVWAFKASASNSTAAQLTISAATR